jgi:hypothetical protein
LIRKTDTACSLKRAGRTFFYVIAEAYVARICKKRATAPMRPLRKSDS